MQAKFVGVPVEILGIDLSAQMNGAGWSALVVIMSILVAALAMNFLGRA